MFDALPGRYLVLAPDAPRYTIVAVSDGFARATMTTRDAIVGRGLVEVAAPGEGELAASLERVVRERVTDAMAVHRHDVRISDEAGGVVEQRWWSRVNSPVLGPGGELLYVIHRVEDVTELVQRTQVGLEQQKLTATLLGRLDRVEAEIFARVRQLHDANRELERAREAAEAASGAKSEFLSSLSHELRTPLQAILGFAQLLEHDRAHPLDGHQLERLRYVVRGGEHLQRLIDDALDLSQIEARRLRVTLVPVDVASVLREVMTTLEPLAARAQIALDLPALPPDLPHMLADRTRLLQVLINFGSNAIKYGRVRGHVGYRAERLDDSLRITVVDDGIGIPADRRSGIFEPFQRAGQELGSIDGTGIGLTISKRLVELMGGAIGFTSEAGLGSEFWITLPAEHAGELRRCAPD